MERTLPEASQTAANYNNVQQQQQSDPCAQLVNVLMCYHQGGEDPEFIRKAIESLVKKLKERRDQLDALISAVTSGGKQQTNCVTIHRSLDGRLQVAGRKGVPNVVYARIWRWPNVSKTELVKLPLCTTPTDHPDLICINPYHYDRIVSSGLSNFKLSSFWMEPLPSTSSSSHEYGGNQLQNSESIPNNAIQNNEYQHNNNNPAPPTEQSSYRVLAHYPVNNNESNLSPPIANQPNWPSTTCMLDQPLQNPMINNYNLKFHQVPQLRNPPTHWCSITYFELDTQVGETFKAGWGMNEIYIDGGMDPAGADSGRFCLGALSNVHRSEPSERARLHIGRGVRLQMDKEGCNIFLECLSRKGIFVRSYFLDFQQALQYGSAVHKFCSGTHRKVFDLDWAYAEMCEQKQNANMAAMIQAYAVAGIVPQTGSPKNATTGVDSLRRTCCTIALSFVKGWGAGYARSNIKETPCWIEIQLHRPLQLLNELLSQSDT